MAQNDGTYYEGPYSLGDNEGNPRRSWEVDCTAGSGSVKLYMLASHGTAQATAQDVTDAVFGEDYLEASTDGRLTFCDSDGKMNGWENCWLKLVLATGGANDADYETPTEKRWK